MKIKNLKNSEYSTCMRTLHNAFGIDWTKPYLEIEHTGKFTVKSLENEVASHGFTPADSLVLALVKGAYSWDKNEWRAVKMTGADFEIDLPNCIDKFYRKYDFNDARKMPTCDAIFFAQKKEYLVGSEYAHNSWSGYSANRKCVDDHGRFTPENASYRIDRLDKSGYDLAVYRAELKTRAKAYKEARDKEAYLSTDNTAKITVLEGLVAAYKKKLSEEILLVKTVEDAAVMRDHTSWGGLYSIMNTFETFKRKTLEKSYRSVEASEADYNEVLKACAAYLG